MNQKLITDKDSVSSLAEVKGDEQANITTVGEVP